MSDTSPILSLPLIQPAQAQKHITHNEALRVLDVVVQLVVIATDQTAPPAGATAGDRYIVAAPASGAWTDHAGEVAYFIDGAWSFVVPHAGWRAQVLTPKKSVVYDPVAGWEEAVIAGTAEETSQLGINTIADATNRLSVSSPATLLSHEGGGHQLKLNKAAAAETASLLYQNNFSGRAEMGLAGDDDFAIKVSPDGTTWTNALTVDAGSGVADLVAGARIDGNDAYHRGNILAPVSELAGEPTGGVIERASNANGEYIRFADGSMICKSPVFRVDITIAAAAIWRSDVATWTYPYPFVVTPHLCPGGQNNSNVYWSIAGVATPTTGQGTAMSYLSITDRVVKLVAIGRWF